MAQAGLQIDASEMAFLANQMEGYESANEWSRQSSELKISSVIDCGNDGISLRMIGRFSLCIVLFYFICK